MPDMYRPLLLLTTAGWLEFGVLLTLSWGKGCYICTVLFPTLIYDWCTSPWLVYCISIWLAWLLLAWCSHGHCDIINQVIVVYLGSRVLIVVPCVVVDLEFLVL